MRLRPDQGETALGCNWDPAHGSGHRRPGACSSWQHLQGAHCPLDWQFTLDISPQNTVPGRGNAVRVATRRGFRDSKAERQPASRRGRAVPVSWDVTSNYTRVYVLYSFKTKHRKDRPRPVGDSGERITGRTHFRIGLWHD